jgi:hypothetical protein
MIAFSMRPKIKIASKALPRIRRNATVTRSKLR